MKVAITGSSGLIGSALQARLRDEGHQVVRLVRRPPEGPDQVQWDPAAGRLDSSTLTDVHAAVNLAGVGIGDRRWNRQHQEAARRSRIDATTTLSRAIAEAGVPVLISGSAVGWYGDTGDREVDESAPAGTGFLPQLCTAWEGATAPAREAGTRVAFTRTGLVLAPGGGMMSRVRPLFAMGAGGRLGSGRQYWPWISLADEVAAILFLLTAPVSGPVNLTGPVPVTNAEFTHTLSRLMHRPAVFPVPATALRVALGGFADEGVLVSQRVVPRVLEREGFAFTHPTLDRALQWALHPDDRAA
jgi:uncharacterized protein (TIGR01777 family)